MPLDYREPQRPPRSRRPQKIHFRNKFIDKTSDIFISHRKRTNNKLALKRRYDGIITTPGDPFQMSEITEIEFLFVNKVLQSLQYNSNKYASVSLLRSCLLYEIIRKTTDKLCKKSCLVVQGYNNNKKTDLLI